jgi:hypothetical protein
MEKKYKTILSMFLSLVIKKAIEYPNTQQTSCLRN